MERTGGELRHSSPPAWGGPEVKVVKILNNNLVFAKDDAGREVIVKGLGIGFHANRGDTVDESRIGQIFYPQASQNLQQIQEFLLSIPAEYLNFVQDFVDEVKAREGVSFNSSIYLSLSDHLQGTLKRYREGISLQNVLLLDIQRLYKKEYTWGEQMLAKVAKVFGVQLPPDEAGFIALHFVNAEENQGGGDSYKIAAIVSDIVKTVRDYYSDLWFDENSLYYQRFLTHLKYFAQRYLHKELQANEDDGLFQLVSQQYRQAYGCVKLIFLMMEERYGYQMSKEEMMYLTIHIQTNAEHARRKDSQA